MTQIIFSGGTFTGSSSGLVGYQVVDFLDRGLVLDCRRHIDCSRCSRLYLRQKAKWPVFSLLSGTMRSDAPTSASIRPASKSCWTAALASVAGLAGFSYANFSAVVAPELTSFVFGTEPVIHVALGGRGTLIGPVLGTIGIDVLSFYLSGDLPYVWKLIVGLIFIAVIVVLPESHCAALAVVAWRRLAHARRATGCERPVVDLRSKPAVVVSTATLEMVGVSKSFGSLKVLEGINLTIADGELVSLVGPNGSWQDHADALRVSDGQERVRAGWCA